MILDTMTKDELIDLVNEYKMRNTDLKEKIKRIHLISSAMRFDNPAHKRRK